MENQKKSKNVIATNSQDPSKGLDDFNDRLDENLESEDQNNTTADDNAKDFAEKFSGFDSIKN